MQSPQINWMNRSSEDRSDFNLDLRRPLTNYESGSVSGGILSDHTAGHSFTDALGNARKRGSNSKKRGFAILDGQVNQIDIHGEPGEISDKEIDCRATLQGKAGLRRHVGQRAHQQRGLRFKNFTGHRDRLLSQTIPLAA
jgi:hypothetical protein